MTKRVTLACLVMVMLPMAARAQGEDDVAGIVRQLQEAATRASALGKAKALPEGAILALWKAYGDPRLPAEVRTDVRDALEAVYARARTARAEADLRVAISWRERSGMELLRKSDTPAKDAAINALKEMDDRTPRAFNSLKAAVDAGCTDPLVRYHYLATALSNRRMDPAEVMRQCPRLVADYEKSAYGAGRKMAAHLLYVDSATQARGPALITMARKQELLDKALALFPEFLAEDPGRSNIRAMIDNIREVSIRVYGVTSEIPSKKSFDAIDPGLAKALEGTPWLAAFESAFFCSYGNTFHDVSREQFDAHTQQWMEKASTAAEAGWQLDPLDPACPLVMVKVSKFLRLDRRVMETWFLRGYLADPHSYELCTEKLQYLVRTGASDAELVDFGRFCVDRGSWQDRLPLILLDVHFTRAAYTRDADRYFRQPGVWPDLRQAYETMLEDPERIKKDANATRIDRARYLQNACRAGQWKEALALLDRFGNDYAPAGWVFGKSYEENRKGIAEKAAAE